MLTLKSELGFCSNKNRYRQKLEIIQDIFNVIGRGCKKTEIIYGANLNSLQFKKYIDILIMNNFVEYISNSKIYRITDKGIDIIEVVSEITRIYQELSKSEELLYAK